MVLFRKHLLPFRPMIKFTFGPRGTSSMVWHMKFTNVTFSIIPTSASDCKVIKWMLTEPNQHLMRCLSLKKKTGIQNKKAMIWITLLGKFENSSSLLFYKEKHLQHYSTSFEGLLVSFKFFHLNKWKRTLCGSIFKEIK